jgi:hypothetical protein
MFDSVVDHVTTLAERCQILRTVVGRIMIEMGTGNHDVRRAECRATEDDDGLHHPALTAALATAPTIPPAADAEMLDMMEMRPTTMIAAPLCTHQADFA